MQASRVDTVTQVHSFDYAIEHELERSGVLISVIAEWRCVVEIPDIDQGDGRGVPVDLEKGGLTGLTQLDVKHAADAGLVQHQKLRNGRMSLERPET